MAKKQAQEEHFEEIDVGDELLAWETWEFPPHERSRNWYIIAGVVGVVLIVSAILSGNFLFAIIVLMMGVILLMGHLRRPERITMHVTTLGLVLGTEFCRYRDIKDFSIIYDPPDVKLLYVDFHRLSHPLVALPLEGVNPNLLREALLPYIFENLDREEESLTDTLSRVYKL